VALHAVVGGLTGGVQGAVGAGTASAAAPVLDDLQGQFQQGLQKAGLGEDASKLIASVASGTAAAGIGATASGGSVSGGATAFNADMNNRQIGQEERRLAQSLASKAKVSGLTKPDGSAYTQAEIENAMRNSGKGSESITQGMQVDPNKPNAITDKDAVWTSNDGKTLVQVNQDGSNLNPGAIDPKLAAYIVQETGGANTPYKDLFKQVEAAKAGPATNLNAHLNTMTPAANGCVTAECSANVGPVTNPMTLLPHWVLVLFLPVLALSRVIRR
jgi:filamentous hemagglutinin